MKSGKPWSCFHRAVRVYRPEAAIARNIYAGAVLYPESRAWFAQDLGSYLGAYDYTVVMAYAAMDGVWNSRKWYSELFNAAGGRAQAEKVIYKLQAYDWKKKSWIRAQAARSIKQPTSKMRQS